MLDFQSAYIDVPVTQYRPLIYILRIKAEGGDLQTDNWDCTVFM
jgi:hypothetical protein